METLAEIMQRAWWNHQAGLWQLAEQLYRQVLQVDPNHIDAAYLCGAVCHVQGNLDEAMHLYLRVLQQQPNHAEVNSNLSSVLMSKGRHEEAAECCRLAIRTKPHFADGYNNLGMALTGWGKLDEAIHVLEEGLKVSPGHSSLRANLGMALELSKRFAEALACYQEVLRADPNNGLAYNNLGNALHHLGKLDEAVAAYESALRLRPDLVEIYCNFARLQCDRGNAQEGLRLFEQALQRNPDAALIHFGRAITWLSQGDFERGWPEYEWRWRLIEQLKRPGAQPRWDGASLEGRTILLQAEQGLGDTIQFIRYAALVKQRGGRVVVECQPPLVNLLGRCPGIDQVVARGSDLPPFDTHAPLLSLPGILGTTLATIPADIPYLFVDREVTEKWRDQLGSIPDFKVGIAWQGDPVQKNDYHRSIKLAQFAPLKEMPGVRLVSLQKGFGSEQVESLRDRPEILDLNTRLQDFQDTAAAMLNLDLVVTVDTAVAHCAGALGVPVWVLLAYSADWRWLTKRDDSPWYPSVRLFQQTETGNWKGVFERVCRALQEKLGRILTPVLNSADSPENSKPSADAEVTAQQEPTQSTPVSECPVQDRSRVQTTTPDHEDSWFRLGETHLEQGRFAEAADAYRQGLKLAPHLAWAWNSLGIVLAHLAHWDKAESCFREATDRQADYAEAYHNLGFALASQAKLAEAESCYRRALRIRPDYPEAHNNLGMVHWYRGKLSEAIASHRQALQFRPEYAGAVECLARALATQNRIFDEYSRFRMNNWYLSDDAVAWNHLGVALRNGVRADDDIYCFQEALRLQPDFPEALNNLGATFRERGYTAEAMEVLQRTLALRPDFNDARNNLGAALEAAGRYEEAQSCYLQVLRIRPDYAEAHSNLGVVLDKLGHFAKALQHYQTAVKLKPNYAQAFVNMGKTQTALGALDEAIASYDKALELRTDDVEARVGRALVWLRQGDFERGWPEFEWRWRRREFPPRPFGRPIWDGSPLAGRRILLHAEQGLGDTLQFIRYAPLVKACGGQVIVECQESLLPLLASCPAIEMLVKKDYQLPAFDTHAPLLSLPRIFKTTLPTIPATCPYLFADPATVEKWRTRVNAFPGLKVGLAWQGNPRNTNDRHRSVPLICFEPLLTCQGVQFFSVQAGPGAEQLKALPRQESIIDLGSRFENFQDTAAVLKNLDLVITVDSAVAHCAGALGVEVWMLTPFACDWRWLSNRKDSPWYPSMRLFRQHLPGDWNDVIKRMALALCEKLAR